MNPYYPKNSIHFPLIQFQNEEISSYFHDSNVLDVIQNDLCTSHNNFDFGDKNFKDDPFCNDDDDELKKLDKKLYKSVSLDDNQHQPSRSISESENLQYTQDQQIFNLPTLFFTYLLFPTLTLFMILLRHSLINQTSLCISINHKSPIEALARSTNTSRENYCLFNPLPSFTDKYSFSRKPK